ncbi:MAG: P-loop NTPase [Deltaproteobacteria bacterium]|nr:P-loop NTPase [Deltaproteobacteria bacterium]
MPMAELQTAFDFPELHRKGSRQPAVICVGGGKGGIGKTLLTANLGICFARSGIKVVLLDADLGGSNLHTTLGMDLPDISLSDFVQRRVERLEDTIVDSGVEGLGLISGAQDFLGSANIKYTQKMRVLKRILKIDCDLVIMDLGSGTSFNVLDFFLVADLGLVMLVPEPTSLENSYRFIKSAFYRLLKHRETSRPILKLLDDAMESCNEMGIRTPYDLIRVVARLDPERGDVYRSLMLEFRPLLVVNQVRTPEDAELGMAVRTACRKYFGIDLDYLGSIDFDDSVWQAVRRRSVLLEHDPESAFSRSVWKIAGTIARRLRHIERPSGWLF